MKEFRKTNVVTYNLMSFTGFKSLLLFTILCESPKSYSEVCDYFKNHPYIKEEMSADTFRVYLTSLRRCGCEIEVKRMKGGAKYQIVSQPFEFKISEGEIKGIIKIYRIISNTSDVKGLVAFDRFINKLITLTNNEKLRAAFNKVSIFRGIDLDLVDELLNCCDKKCQVDFLYNSPKGEVIPVELIADKVDISNGKVYLYGMNLKYKQYSYFRVQLIESISSVKLGTVDLSDVESIRVKYELKSLPRYYRLSDEEKIVEINENSIIVEMESSNKFLLKQKILEYGKYCTVLEPESFKQEIVDTLKKMQEVYYGSK